MKNYYSVVSIISKTKQIKLLDCFSTLSSCLLAHRLTTDSWHVYPNFGNKFCTPSKKEIVHTNNLFGKSLSF